MFDRNVFIRKRKSMQWWGVFLFWGGIALFAIDLTTPFPTRVSAQFTAVWLGLISLPGAILWIKSQSLPLAEAMEAIGYSRAFMTNGLTPADLAITMGITPNTAAKILSELIKEGNARIEVIDRVNGPVQVFKLVTTNTEQNQQL